MTTACAPGVLRTIPLFQNLTSEQLEEISASVRLRTVAAGTHLILAEQPSEVFYIILSGAVEARVEQADGTCFILAIHGPGEVLGEINLLDSEGYPVTAVTREDSLLAWMNRTAFGDCLRSMPAITYNLITILSQRLRLAHKQIQSLASLDVYGRIARQILALAQQYGECVADGDIRIPLRLTQNDLAALVGASRVRVNQVLVSFKRRKYISVDEHHFISVHDSVALAQCCR